MAPRSKTTELKSHILSEAARWEKMKDEIPFLDELEDLTQAIERGQTKLSEVEGAVSRVQVSLQKLADEEQAKRKALDEEVSAKTKELEEAVAEARKNLADSASALKTALAEANAEKNTLLEQAREAANKIVSDAKKAVEDNRQKMLAEEVALENRVTSLREQKDNLEAAVERAQQLRREAVKALETV